MVWLELLLIVRFLVVVLVVLFVLVLVGFGIVTTVSIAVINQIIDLKIG